MRIAAPRPEAPHDKTEVFRTAREAAEYLERYSYDAEEMHGIVERLRACLEGVRK